MTAARARFAEGHNRYMEVLARQIVNEESGVVPSGYWNALEEIDDFYWPWRASGRVLLRSGRWDEEESRFQASLRRFDARLEYYLRLARKERDKRQSMSEALEGAESQPEDFIDFVSMLE